MTCGAREAAVGGDRPQRRSRQDEWRQADKDQLKPIAELDGSGNLTARFVYGSKPNVPDAVMKYSGGVVTTYRVISDHLGSPVMAVNVNNSSDVPFSAEYSAFGERTVSTGVSSEGWMPFGFAGGLYDADTKLTRFGARDYDPVVGRWTAEDPVLWHGGLSNLYSYVGSDAVNRVDLLGLLTIGVGPYVGACGFGICVTGALTYVTDLASMDVNLAFSIGLATQPFSATIGAAVEVTNASSIDDLNGIEFYAGASAGSIVTGTANAIAGTGYQGGSLGVGFGPAVSPAEIHAGATVGANLYSRLWRDLTGTHDCAK